MSAFKGTPGPWEIESRTTPTPGVDVAWSIRNSEWHTIAGGQSQEHLGESGIHALECSANARLIAAAPALHNIADRIDTYLGMAGEPAEESSNNPLRDLRFEVQRVLAEIAGDAS